MFLSKTNSLCHTKNFCLPLSARLMLLRAGRQLITSGSFIQSSTLTASCDALMPFSGTSHELFWDSSSPLVISANASRTKLVPDLPVPE